MLYLTVAVILKNEIKIKKQTYNIFFHSCRKSKILRIKNNNIRRKSKIRYYFPLYVC